MALEAIDPFVLSLQGKSCLAVVKPVRPFKLVERFLGMALLAVGQEFIEVDIVVATAAIGERNVGKTLEFSSVPRFFLVAIDAFNGFVLAKQGEVRFVVAEFSGRSKLFRGMAASAIGRKGCLVVIGVAGSAFLAGAKIGIGFFLQLPVFDKIGLMAFPAVNGLVRSRQFIPGKAVVEQFLFQMHHVEIPAVVVAVALGAFLSLYFF